MLARTTRGHIFDKAGRGLDSLVAKFGSPEAAYRAVEQATQDMVRQLPLRSDGVFENVLVSVGGTVVQVSGRVIDGVVRIGTSYP